VSSVFHKLKITNQKSQIPKSKIEHGSNGCDGLERINLHQGVNNHRVHREITQSSQRIIITIPIIQNFYPKLIFASSILVVF
jgi:hypothetical protein